MEKTLIRNRVIQYFEPEAITFDAGFNRLNRFQLRESTPENAVSILREHNIKAKIFAIHSSRRQVFEVKSRELDWEVMPLKKLKVNVPAEILERIELLLQEGIEIKKLYIAKPKQYAFAEILKSEVSLQLRILSQEIAYVSVGMLAGFEEAVSVIKEAARRKQNAVNMIPQYLSDPVLLAKIKGHNELIEIGRWL